MKALGPEQIREMRRSFEATQVEFAKAVGVAPETISRWEHGALTPSPLALDKLHQIARRAWLGDPPRF